MNKAITVMLILLGVLIILLYPSLHLEGGNVILFFISVFVIGFIWSYSFQILSEVRHWFWDLGYGFELTTSKITGVCLLYTSDAADE